MNSTMKWSFPSLVRGSYRSLVSVTFHQMLTEHLLGAPCVLLRKMHNWKKEWIINGRILGMRTGMGRRLLVQHSQHQCECFPTERTSWSWLNVPWSSITGRLLRHQLLPYMSRKVPRPLQRRTQVGGCSHIAGEASRDHNPTHGKEGPESVTDTVWLFPLPFCCPLR